MKMIYIIFVKEQEVLILRNRKLGSNSNILIILALQPDGVNL